MLAYWGEVEASNADGCGGGDLREDCRFGFGSGVWGVMWMNGEGGVYGGMHGGRLYLVGAE